MLLSKKNVLSYSESKPINDPILDYKKNYMSNLRRIWLCAQHKKELEHKEH